MTPQMSSTGVRTVVHVMRHGEVHNPTGVLYGRLPDFHLSELGQDMARTVADHLAAHDVTHVVASSLDRAQETAAPIAAAHDLAIHTDDRVIEAGNYFEGRTFGVGDGSLRHPEHWPKLVNPFRPSWGEPYNDVAARMLAMMETARKAAAGQEAVCVSHQLPIWVTRRMAERKRLWHNPTSRECALGSVTSFTYTGDQLTGISYTVPARRQVTQGDAAQ